MADILEDILQRKRREVAGKRKVLPFSYLFSMAKEVPSRPRFSHTFVSDTGIIAEIKRSSPSRGALFSGGRIEDLGEIYKENGASAVSLVTEQKYFRGNLMDLQKLTSRVDIPVLRKDFIVDEYQILESKLSGAEAVLLIVSILSSEKLSKFLDLVNEIGIEAVVEIHNREELMKSLDVNAKIIGINNRNLKTLHVDLSTSKMLLPLIPDSKIKIVESGIRDENDLISFSGYKVNAFLIGEALVTASNPAEILSRFCSVLRKK